MHAREKIREFLHTTMKKEKKTAMSVYHLYITTRDRVCVHVCVCVHTFVSVPVCLCQVITMFQPWITAASHALGQAILPSLGSFTAMLLKTKPNKNEIISLIIFFCVLCSLTGKKICLTYTNACYFLMIYYYKYFLCFYIWWSVTDWMGWLKQSWLHMSFVWSLTLHGRAAQRPMNSPVNKDVWKQCSDWGIAAHKDPHTLPRLKSLPAGLWFPHA